MKVFRLILLCLYIFLIGCKSDRETKISNSLIERLEISSNELVESSEAAYTELIRKSRQPELEGKLSSWMPVVRSVRQQSADLCGGLDELRLKRSKESVNSVVNALRQYSDSLHSLIIDSTARQTLVDSFIPMKEWKQIQAEDLE